MNFNVKSLVCFAYDPGFFFFQRGIVRFVHRKKNINKRFDLPDVMQAWHSEKTTLIEYEFRCF